MTRPDHALRIYCFETHLGWAALVQSWDKLHQVTFGHRSAARALAALDVSLTIQAVPAHDVPILAERLLAFTAGAEDDFRDVDIELSLATPFQHRVIQRCRRIPYGKTLGYGQLAAAIGSRGAARAVGNVMAANRYPLVVPCHRVVNSDGTLGNYSAPDGPKLKARLLELESSGASCPAVALLTPKAVQGAV